MKTVLVDLLEGESCPIASIRLVGSNLKLIALIDTGASLPVWVGSREILLLLGAKPSGDEGSFTGFGGSTKGIIYEIPAFNIGELTYPNMPIVLQDDFTVKRVINGRLVETKPIYNIVLSASLFYGMIYEVDTINSKFKITIPDNNMVRRTHIKSVNGELEFVLAQN